MNKIIIEYPSTVKFFNINEYINNINDNCVFVIDSKINKLYDFKIADNKRIVISANEKSKTFKAVYKIIDHLLTYNYDKNITLIGVGGGIICDITSFVSSIYKRGTEHILIPTTLLAMVDASYGGKTGINYKNIKNLIGTFKIPKEVLIDINFLNTLSKLEILNGLGEVIKISLTSNYQLFEFLINNKNYYLEQIQFIIKESILTKYNIIKYDLYDNNIRKILNFGHTIGHIIEINNKIKHGIAISIGGIEELKLLNKLSNQPIEIIDNYTAILDSYNMPINDIVVSKSIIKQLLNDKKVMSNTIDLIKITSIGKSAIQKVNLKDILVHYDIY